MLGILQVFTTRVSHGLGITYAQRTMRLDFVQKKAARASVQVKVLAAMSVG